jgi:hypothetical protein
MRISPRRVAIAFGIVVVLAAGAAAGQEDPVFLHPWGMSLSVGGGVADFVGDELRDMTGVAGTWDVRFGFGTRKLFGIEAAYVGSAQDIDALGLDRNAVLVGHGVEGAVRVNLLEGVFQPYVFAGAGWRRYTLSQVATNTSDLQSEDDVVELPLGLGLGIHYDRFILDLRGTYRPAEGEDLVPARAQTGRTLDSYGLSGHLGFQF